MAQICVLATALVLVFLGVESEAASYGHGGGVIGYGFSCPTLFDYYADDNDCTRFYRCNWGTAYSFKCGEGTRWNQYLLTCDHAYNVPCHQQIAYGSYEYQPNQVEYQSHQVAYEPRPIVHQTQSQNDYGVENYASSRINYPAVVHSSPTQTYGSYDTYSYQQPDYQTHSYPPRTDYSGYTSSRQSFHSPLFSYLLGARRH